MTKVGIVDEIFHDVGVDYSTKVVVNLYRRGRKQTAAQIKANDRPPRPRPIVVVYLRQYEKAELFRNLHSLKGNEKWKNVFFNDDFTQLQAIEQRDKLNVSGEYMEIMEHKSATFDNLASFAESYLRLHPFDVVYVAGGATNITDKDNATKQISYGWGRGPNLQEHLTSLLKRADKSSRKNFPASRVVYCPLIGIDLAKAVTAHPITTEEQHTVDNVIWEFNSQIFRIYKERGTFCPSLHHQVHRICKGKRKEYYHHLSDGLHLTGSLKESWANQFVNAIAHN